MNSEFTAMRPRPQADGFTGEPRGAFEELRRRARSGAAVTPEEVFAAAGLSPLERHVVEERYLARSHQEIALDPPMRRPDGGVYTRQRVKQVEQQALAKLGLGESLATLVHDQDRIDRALDLRERGRRVRLAELHACQEAARCANFRRLRALERAEARADRLADLWMQENEAAPNHGRRVRAG